MRKALIHRASWLSDIVICLLFSTSGNPKLINHNLAQKKKKKCNYFSARDGAPLWFTMAPAAADD